MSSKKIYNKILDTVLVLLIFKACGFATCSVKKYSSIKTGNFPLFIPSKRAKIYNVCVLICLSIASIYVIHGIKNYDIFFMNKMTTVTTYTDLTVSFLAAMSAVFLFTIRQKSFVNIINRFIQIDVGLKTVAKGQSNQPQYNFLIILTHFCVLIVAFILNSLVFSVDTFAIGYHVPYILVEMFIYQFGFIVKSIEMQFRTINQAMEDFFIQKKFEIGDEWYSLYANKIGRELILHLRQTHLKLCEFGTDVTNFYSTTFICCSVSTLYGTTRACFNLYLTIVSPEFIVPLFVNNVMWILLVFYPVSLLSTNVTNCSYEVCKQIYRLLFLK